MDKILQWAPIIMSVLLFLWILLILHTIKFCFGHQRRRIENLEARIATLECSINDERSVEP